MKVYFERNLMNENVGWRDQIACSYGGFNNIVFKNNSFNVKPIKCSKILLTILIRSISNIHGHYKNSTKKLIAILTI